MYYTFMCRCMKNKVYVPNTWNSVGSLNIDM